MCQIESQSAPIYTEQKETKQHFFCTDSFNTNYTKIKYAKKKKKSKNHSNLDSPTFQTEW